MECRDAEDVPTMKQNAQLAQSAALSLEIIVIVWCVRRHVGCVNTDRCCRHGRKQVYTVHMFECYLDPWHEGIVSLRFLDFGLKRQKTGLQFYLRDDKGQTLKCSFSLRIVKCS